VDELIEQLRQWARPSCWFSVCWMRCLCRWHCSDVCIMLWFTEISRHM